MARPEKKYNNYRQKVTQKGLYLEKEARSIYRQVFVRKHMPKGDLPSLNQGEKESLGSMPI